MSNAFNKQVKIGLSLIAGFYICWIFLGSYILGSALIDALKVLLFWAVAVFFPGLAVCKLIRLKLSPLELLVSIPMFGFASMTVAYFIFAPFGLVDYSLIIIVVQAVLSAVYLFASRKKRIEYADDSGEVLIASIFAVIAGLMTFILLSADMISPGLTGTRYYYHDILNGVSLTTSASNSFPMQILQMAGTEHRYHLFYYVLTGLEKLFTGISAFEVTTKYSLVLMSPLAVLAFVALAKKLICNRWIIACCTVLLTIVPGHFMYYMYQEAGGYQESMFYALMAVLFFLKAENEKQKRYSVNYGISVLSIVMCLGAKGPIAVPIVFGICFVLLIDLLTGKGKNIIVKGLSFAISFLVSYFLIYASGAGDSMAMKGIETALNSPFVKGLTNPGLPTFIFNTIAVLLYIFKDSLLMLLGFVIAIIQICRKRASEYELFMVSGIGIGFILRTLFSQMGSSEIYFINIMIPFSLILFGVMLESSLLIPVKRNKVGTISSVGLVLCLCMICIFDLIPVSARCFIGTHHGQYVPRSFGFADAVTHSRFSEDNLWTTDELIEEYGDDYDKLPMITPYQYEAYLWLRDNTPRNAVIADGHYLLSNKYFYGTAFSERPFFLEGYGYVTMENSNDNTNEMVRREGILHWFYTDEDQDFIPLIAKSGCDYIIISQYLNPGMELLPEYGNKVFENEVISIYKLNK